MPFHLRQFHKTYDLIWAWTVRTLSGRYQQSALGWLWAIVQPVAAVAIYAVVFTRIVPVDTGGVPYILFSYAAVVPWTFLSASLPDMAVSMVQNMNLIGKINFSREALPIAMMLARLADLGVSLILLGFLILYYRINVSWVCLLYLPVVLIAQILLVLGIGIGSSALNVFYRDVDPLLKLIIQVWFYASPILYPVAMVPVNWRWLYFINPMSGIVASWRDIFVYGTPPGNYLLTAALVSGIIFLGGVWFFKRVEHQFADII